MGWVRMGHAPGRRAATTPRSDWETPTRAARRRSPQTRAGPGARGIGLCLDAPFDRFGRNVGLDPGPEPGMGVDNQVAPHDLHAIREVGEADAGLDPRGIEAEAGVVDGEGQA